MDFIDPILSAASQIYSLVENVRANKKRCRRVRSRVEALENLVKSIKERGVQGQTSAEVEKALKELSITLESAQTLIKKYTEANWVVRILKSSGHEDEFNSVNERLDDAFQVLSGALQVEQGNMLYKVFEQTSREKEDEEAGREDDIEMATLLLEYMKDQKETTERLKSDMEKVLALLNKPKVTNEVIRMIKPQELRYEHPIEPFMTTTNSEVYRGEYRGFTVAIKRYTDTLITTAREVQSVFNKEVETMKRFESPYILRMFGICVQDEDGPNPQFLIIMEYCEKGSLRQVLDSGCELSSTVKARMCLHAAQGLYRLHQTEEKYKVHGCIKSNRFLVAEGYRVKLGGFELAKTESSLKKTTKDKLNRSLWYSSPQRLNNINHYSKECEIYSLGIVLWEIVTRKKPFEGWSDTEICQKVGKDQFQEPIPEDCDCPEQLGKLINACRAYDVFKRPSAGVLVDELRRMVAQLEE